MDIDLLAKRKFKQFYVDYPRINAVNPLKIVAINEIRRDLYCIADESDPGNKHVAWMVGIYHIGCPDACPEYCTIVVDDSAYYCFTEQWSRPKYYPALTVYDRAVIMKAVKAAVQRL